MADVKISALPAAGALDGTENPPVVQGGVTKKMTLSQLLSYLNGLAQLQLGNNFINIKPTGITANFWGILADGSASFAGGGILTIAADGTLDINGGSVTLSPDGSALLASGAFTVTGIGLLLTSKPIEITTAGEGYIMKSPDATRWKVTIDNLGQLSTNPA